ncbi:MAG: N-acetylglucosamine-6-phosphate deacetylase [Leptolyngbyaceae cyanobacterium MO_188.B28]|nr:N-acetylglucosamine-6-phosphate deacetylase [Leptolyngbyaceae cyanobacterium MO_188.B28]
MSPNLTITNARISNKPGLQYLSICDGIITAISPMSSTLPKPQGGESTQLDVKGDWVSLGGVDLQINGALGLAFPDLGPEDQETLAKICEFLWDQGIDAFMPTLVTTAVEKIHQALTLIQKFSAQPTHRQSAQILGVHLEGPFLNPEKRGAHPAEYLLPLTLDQVKRVLGKGGEGVKIITLAPEIDLKGDVIPYLKSLGVTVSLGHSQATAAEAEAAFEQGASMVTHAFNAMPGLHHRQPGLLGAAIAHPAVYCGLIADGEHVCPTMLNVFLRACRGSLSPAKHCPGVFLVSDALSPFGLPDGSYPWDSRQIDVQQGTARLPNGVLAGTTLSLLRGIQNLVEWDICEVGEAIALATEAPRDAIGLPGLSPGRPAHLLRWSLNQSSRQLTWRRLNITNG